LAECEICGRIERLTPENPYFVAEMKTGYVALGDHQTYRGYTVFVAKTCVAELHLLPRDERSLFLEEMATVAEAVFRAFEPRKLNYELLGNSVAHLHWHLYPRHADDPEPTWPVWNDPRLREAFGKPPAVEADVLQELRSRLQRELAALR
jgi:diadenosine tetraphosphate (Ap4A) HIT family hydrolase